MIEKTEFLVFRALLDHIVDGALDIQERMMRGETVIRSELVRRIAALFDLNNFFGRVKSTSTLDLLLLEASKSSPSKT